MIKNIIASSDRSGFLFAVANVIVFLYLAFVSIGCGISQFSPDSWSYFELARSVLEEEFYTFNTYRSYFSYDRSAAFPFGYPILLASFNAIFGWNPENAVYLNAGLAFIAFIITIKIARKLCLSRLIAYSLALSLVFYSAFLNEVVAGRAYPAAIFFLLCGIFILVSSSTSWLLLVGSIFVGISAIIRFDFLVSGWSLVMLVLWFQRRQAVSYFTCLVGFFLGLLPWVIFSMIFFQSPWVSDNSWVSLAAQPSHVLDFPPKAKYTIFSDPYSWLGKIAYNSIKLFKYTIESSKSYPLLPFLFFWFIIYGLTKNEVTFKAIMPYLFFMAVMLLPYLLTGYFDPRYFTLFYLVASFCLAVFYVHHDDADKINSVFLIMILVVFFYSFSFFIDHVGSAYKNRKVYENNLEMIHLIGSCHKQEPELTYIFKDGAAVIDAFRYGAITGHRTAILPANYSKLDRDELNLFFASITPYRIISSIHELDCADIPKDKQLIP